MKLPIQLPDEYQQKKPQSELIKFYDDSGHDGDERFFLYADALTNGDFETLDRIRAEHAGDVKLIRRLNTLERTRLAEMERFRREIQLARRERDGYRILVEAHVSENTRGRTHKTKFKRGRAILKQCAEERKKHDTPRIAQGFAAV